MMKNITSKTIHINLSKSDNVTNSYDVTLYVTQATQTCEFVNGEFVYIDIGT